MRRCSLFSTLFAVRVNDLALEIEESDLDIHLENLTECSVVFLCLWCPFLSMIQ